MLSLVILDIGKDHKHTVQTQIRLVHLIINCSAFLNKHNRKKFDDESRYLEVFEHTMCIQIILLLLILSYAIFFSILLFQKLAFLLVSNI